MNIDPGQLNQLLNLVPYPIGKTQLIDFVRQQGVNDQIIGLLEHLPDITFNSAQDVQNALSGFLGILGNPGGFKL
jgi:Protein of unknown function (DUF2795)